MSNIKKSIAGLVTSVFTGVGTLVSLNILSGDAKNYVIGAIAAVTPLLVFLGVYSAPKNEEI